MTETRTPRFNLPQWSAGTDSPSRTDFNGAFSDIEGRGAYDNGDNVSSLPVSGLVAGRYSMLIVSGDGYSLYRYSGATWQFVGGSLVPRFQRFKAIEGQAITDAAFAVEHPSEVNANIIASYGGDLTVGGVLKSWNANDAAKGALVVGWNGSISLTTTGRAYMRTRSNSELGLVLHAHGSGAGNMLTVREPGNSDIFTVDAIGRLTQRTFAAFGGANLSPTSMVAVAPTSAADAVTNGLLLYGQTAAPTKAMLTVQRDNTADTTPIAQILRDGIGLGRLPWGTPGTGDSSSMTFSVNTLHFRTSGNLANTAYWNFRRSDPTSPVTEANPALDTTLISVGVTGINSGLPLFVSQRHRQNSATMALYRVADFTSSFLDLARLVPDGLGGETAQLMSSWGPDGRLRTGLPWRATGTVREVRQPIVHVCNKRYTPLYAAYTSGQFIARNTYYEYTWPQMTVRSADSADLDITTAVEVMLTQNPDHYGDANSVAIDTWISVNGGSYQFIATSENAPTTSSDFHRFSGDVIYVNHRFLGIAAGATFRFRTRIAVGPTIPEVYVRSIDLKAIEGIVESYVAT